MRTEKN